MDTGSVNNIYKNNCNNVPLVKVSYHRINRSSCCKTTQIAEISKTQEMQDTKPTRDKTHEST